MPEMRVLETKPFWYDVDTYGRTYLGAGLKLRLPCGHDVAMKVSASCTYTTGSMDLELSSSARADQQRYHTLNEISEILDEGCPECGAVYRPIKSVIDEVHATILEEAQCPK
jgi:hypothetical protein